MIFIDERNKIDSILTIILTAMPDQLHALQITNNAHRSQDEFEEDMNTATIVVHPAVQPLLGDSTREFNLPPNVDRLTLLKNFLFKMSQDQQAWVRAVVAEDWDRVDWNTSALERFLKAEQLGISGAVAFAVVSGAMQLRGVAVPKDLHKKLWAAKRSNEDIKRTLKELELKQRAESAKAEIE